MAKKSKIIRNEQRRAIVAKYAQLSRIRFRDMAHRGELPGIAKSSW